MPKYIEDAADRIYSAAADQLKTAGSRKMSMAEVAAAGVSVGTVYNYFGSKAKLIDSVYNTMFKNAVENIVYNGVKTKYSENVYLALCGWIKENKLGENLKLIKEC